MKFGSKASGQGNYMIENQTRYAARAFMLPGLFLLLAASAGCATIVKGTTQSIPVASDPSSADILVDGNLVGQTPTAIQLKRKHDHLVTIQKVGFRPKSVAVVKNVGGAVWGNIIAGGLIGWGVDATTGAQYNLVPKTISVQLEPLSATLQQQGVDDQTAFVTKLKSLDQLHDSKQLSDEEYSKGRLELFRHYMPEVLPADVQKAAPATH
jgi:hypothetical protein